MKENINIDAHIPAKYKKISKNINGNKSLGLKKLSTVSDKSSLNFIRKNLNQVENSKIAKKAKMLTIDEREEIEDILEDNTPEMRKKLKKYKKIKSYMKFKINKDLKGKENQKNYLNYKKYKNVFSQLKKLRNYQKLLNYKKINSDLKDVKDGISVKNIIDRIRVDPIAISKDGLNC